MAKTKSGAKRWAGNHRIACTDLFQKYHEDSTDGASYETVDIENTDYVDSVYRDHAIFQETEKRYFRGHFTDQANRFRLELQERGARRPPPPASELFSSFCYCHSHIRFSLLIYFCSFY